MKSMLFFLMSVLTLSLTACDDDNDIPDHGHIRITHASANAPTVNGSINGRSGWELSGLDYGQSSGLLSYRAGTFSLEVDANVPGENPVVVGPVSLDVAVDMTYDVVVLGEYSNISHVVLSRDAHTPSDEARVTILHAAQGAGEVDIHVTAPDETLSANTLFTRLSFGDDASPEMVVPGSYQVRVTAADDLDVIYDSGDLSFSAGNDIVLIAVNNSQITDSGATKSPISLIANHSHGYSQVLPDRNNGSDVRVIHAIADEGPVDVAVDGDFANVLVESLAFPAFTNYMNIAAAEHLLEVAEEDTTTVLMSDALNFRNNAVYSIYALGEGDNVYLLRTRDNPRRIVTQARLRLVHAAVEAGIVDVYITAPQTDISALNPTLNNIRLRDYTRYLSFAEGDYDITITDHDSKTPVFGPSAINMMNEGVYTAVVRDAPDISASEVALILMDDFTL